MIHSLLPVRSAAAVAVLATCAYFAPATGRAAERVSLFSNGADLRGTVELLAELAGEEVALAPGVEGRLHGRLEGDAAEVLNELVERHDLVLLPRLDVLEARARASGAAPAARAVTLPEPSEPSEPPSVASSEMPSSAAAAESRQTPSGKTTEPVQSPPPIEEIPGYDVDYR